jgi:hypothetical protein
MTRSVFVQFTDARTEYPAAKLIRRNRDGKSVEV